MAKKNSIKLGGKDVEFKDFRNQLPNEFCNILDAYGLNSFEDLEGLAMIMGIDIDKLAKFSEEHGKGVMPAMEDIALDADHPLAEYRAKIFAEADDEDDAPWPDHDWDEDDDDDDGYGDEDDDDLDPFEFPEKVIENGEKVYELHLRIKLNKAPVPIWREIKVPSNISIEFFSWVICDAMGWDNEHLHLFRVKDRMYKNKACRREEEKYSWGVSRIQTLASEDYPISVLFEEEKVRVKYEYDFGDSWEHDIWLKGVREYEPHEKPRLLLHKGVGACPPEDCGGVWGYSDLLEISAKKRKSAEERERLEWYGIDKRFDPNKFDIEKAQMYLDDLWEEGDFDWIEED